MFQSRNSEARRDNLYVFMTCHIVRDDEHLRQLTEQAAEDLSTFGDDFQLKKFNSPRFNVEDRDVDDEGDE